eukprot:464022_1
MGHQISTLNSKHKRNDKNNMKTSTKIEFVLSYWYRNIYSSHKSSSTSQQNVICTVTKKYVHQSIFDNANTIQIINHTENEYYIFNILMFWYLDYDRDKILNFYCNDRLNQSNKINRNETKLIELRDDIDDKIIYKIKLNINTIPKIKTFSSLYYKNNNGVIFVCNANNEHSIDDINDWNAAMDRHSNTANLEKIIFINNKNAECKKLNDKNINLIREIASECNVLDLIEISTDDGYNIHNGFQILIQRILVYVKRKKYPFYG